MWQCLQCSQITIYLSQQAFGAQMYQPAPLVAPIPIGYIPLLLPTLYCGPHLAITNFCLKYSLIDDICIYLTDNGFSTSLAFCHIIVDNLKEIGFKVDEIAKLEEAIEVWAQTPTSSMTN